MIPALVLPGFAPTRILFHYCATRLFAVLVFLPAVVPVHAQQAVPSTELYPFDRVFTTPEERSALDALRRGEASALDDPARVVEITPQSDQVRFSGYVLRADGSQEVWIDGHSESASDGASATPARHGSLRSGEGTVEFRARENQRVLKPGQVWLLNPDVVVESYEAPESNVPELDAEQSSAD